MLNVLMAIVAFFEAIWTADKFLSKDSRLDSHPDREARGAGVTCGLICLIVLLIAAAGGLVWRWWS
jgi:hypothetical protein